MMNLNCQRRIGVGLGLWWASFVVLVGGLVTGPRAEAITLNFANLVGSQVVFKGTGDTFTFTPASPSDQFQITTGGSGAAMGFKGNLTGTYTIGAITTLGAMQSAAVSGSGLLSIHDGAGKDLTATLVWDTISTFGTGGFINVNGLLNLSSLSYAGANADLLALAAPGVGSEVISFQFVPGRSLMQLTANGAVNRTSYSGSMAAEAVADAGSTLALLGLAMLVVAGFSSRRWRTFLKR